ncbi:MAG: hypothetical protein FWC50_00250, partial [Planctomycetaceae bacterium]|nr:hypothetical protein [Planctomycetaceae bacterium]
REGQNLGRKRKPLFPANIVFLTGQWKVFFHEKGIFMKNPIYFLPFVLLFFAGCNKQVLPDGMPKLYPVKMTVTQEGKPLTDAMILLTPVDSQWPAQGTTDVSGVVQKFFTNSKYEGGHCWKIQSLRSKSRAGTCF